MIQIHSVYFIVDFKMETTRAYRGLYRGDMREYFKESKVVPGRVSTGCPKIKGDLIKLIKIKVG